jgi:hypothetical protein
MKSIITNIAVLMSIPATMFLSSCCTRTSWGTCVYPQKCSPIIKYSGNSLDIGEASIPIGGATTVTIKGVKWDTKTLQQAGQVSQAMDLQRVSHCQQINSALATLSYESYEKERAQMIKEQQKLDQLAFLIILNNPAAVEKWLAAYTTTAGNSGAFSLNSKASYAPSKPESNVSTFLK